MTGGQQLTVPCPIEHIPVYQRGGSIIPKKMRVRRSSATMRGDPYTLVVALDTDQESEGGNAEGDLYLDDEHSFDHKKGSFMRRRFTWSGNTLSCTEAPAPYGNPQAASKPLTTLAPSVTVERILVWGWATEPTKVTLTEAGGEARELGFAYAAGVLGLRKPDAHITSDFTITIV